jgi:hypothetical protein
VFRAYLGSPRLVLRDSTDPDSGVTLAARLSTTVSTAHDAITTRSPRGCRSPQVTSLSTAAAPVVAKRHAHQAEKTLTGSGGSIWPHQGGPSWPHLLTPQRWADHRAEFCRLVGKPADAGRALTEATDELGEALDGLEQVLAAGDGPVRLDSDGDLVISPLSAEDVPGEAVAFEGGVDGDAAVRADRVAADRVGQAHRLPGLLHPRRRQADPEPGAQAQPDRGAAGALHQLGADPDGRRVRDLLRRVGVDQRVVRAGGDAARGEPGDHRLPPAAVADAGVRHRHAVLVGRSTVPDAREVGHRQSPEQVFRERRAVDVHARHRPAHHLRHEDHRGDKARGALRAGRDPGQRHRHPGDRARHRYPRGDAGQLRSVRPVGVAALAADPGPGQGHPVPGRVAGGGGGGVPAHRAAAERAS